MRSMRSRPGRADAVRRNAHAATDATAVSTANATFRARVDGCWWIPWIVGVVWSGSPTAPTSVAWASEVVVRPLSVSAPPRSSAATARRASRAIAAERQSSTA